MNGRSAVFFALMLAGCHDGTAPRGDGGAPGVDGGGPLDDGGAPVCSGRALSQSGVLDLPITSVHVTGAVTLAGAPLPLPPPATTRGGLVFTETASGRSSALPLPATGPAGYDTWLAPGVYDVTYESDQAGCPASPSRSLPCNRAVLRRGVALTTSGALDFDLPAPVQVSGAVTLNGAPLPDAGASRGAIVIAGLAFDLGATGAGHYRATIFPGHYDVAFAPDPECGKVPLPCVAGILKSGIAFETDGAFDVDIPAVQLAGAVTLNGAPLPDSPSSRGSIGLELAGGGTAILDLGATGAGHYQATLLPGSYDVSFAAWSSADCASGPFPCRGGVLKSGVSIVQSGVLDLDIRAVEVSGAVTVNGAVMPDVAPPAFRGYLRFSGVPTASLGASGAARYAITLMPGDYDVDYQNDQSGCSDSAIPCNGGRLESQLSIHSSGVLDVDIPSVRVSGVVTLNGAPLPDAAVDRGALWFQGGDQSTGLTTRTLGAAGAGSYRTTLLPGSYSIVYSVPANGCAGPPFPCFGGTVKRDVHLASSGSLDVDVPSIHLTGTMTLNGGAIPGLVGQGDIGFDGGLASIPLAPTYSVWLVPASYVIDFLPSAALCADGPGPGLPCNGQVLFGCP